MELVVQVDGAKGSIMRTRITVLTLVLTAHISLLGQQPPDSSQRSSDKKTDESSPVTYMEHEVGPRHIFMAGAGAAVNQANDTPREWGQGAAGFGRRIGSAFGKHIVHKAIQYPISKLLHEELHYQRSDKHGFLPRLHAALLSTVVTHKTTTGQSTLAVGEISGAFGSGLISRLWQPASTRSFAVGIESGGITLAVDAGVNVLREFWPEIRHPHRRSANPAADPASTTTAIAVPERTLSDEPPVVVELAGIEE